MFTSSPAPNAALKEARSTIMWSKTTPTTSSKLLEAQHEAIEWAKKNGHTPLVARVRHLNDKEKPDHWRAS